MVTHNAPRTSCAERVLNYGHAKRDRVGACAQRELSHKMKPETATPPGPPETIFSCTSVCKQNVLEGKLFSGEVRSQTMNGLRHSEVRCLHVAAVQINHIFVSEGLKPKAHSHTLLHLIACENEVVSGSGCAILCKCSLQWLVRDSALCTIDKSLQRRHSYDAPCVMNSPGQGSPRSGRVQTSMCAHTIVLLYVRASCTRQEGVPPSQAVFNRRCVRKLSF